MGARALQEFAIPRRRHGLAPRDHAAVRDAHAAVNDEVDVELTLYAKPLARTASTEGRVEREDAGGEFGHEGAVFGASEVFRPGDGLALFGYMGVRILVQFLSAFWSLETLHGQSAAPQTKG